EFERYEEVPAKRQILIEKAENLVLAHQLSRGKKRILLLALWTYTGVTVTGLRQISTHIRSGFRRNDTTRINGLSGEVRFFIATFFFARRGPDLRLKEILL